MQLYTNHHREKPQLQQLSTAASLECHETKDDAPVMSQPKMSSERGQRFSTPVIGTGGDHEHGHNESEDEKSRADDSDGAPLSEYGFGVGFSYYKRYRFYPFIAPKFANLKEELLHNDIATVTRDEFAQIYNKAVSKQRERVIERAACNDSFWNELFAIDAGSPMPLPHILSILFYTDLTSLPKDMKTACRRLSLHEAVEAVAQRHRNVVNWLRLLFESITLFGQKYTTRSKPIFHGLDIKFNFAEFKVFPNAQP